MPEEDGFSLMRRLRVANNRVLAVALTGFASSQDAAAAREAGFDLHVPKPLDIDSFVSLLRRLTGWRPAAAVGDSAAHAAAT
jgi:CheY-like chemotaxis protein